MIALSPVHTLRLPVDAQAEARLYHQLEERFGGAGPLEPETARSLQWTFQAKFGPKTITISRTRAWPIPGGRDTWHGEVEARLRSTGAAGSEAWLVETP